MLIDIADAIINFYVLFVKRGRNIYEDMKKKAFENKLIYYARYDMNQNRYLVVYNYDKVLSVFYFYMFNYIWKMSYASMTYLDLDFAFDR